MRICIPTDDGRGLEARIAAHFGSASHFTIVDTESGELEVVHNPGGHHRHGECHHLPLLAPKKIDAVVCRGMGRRALASLEKAGMKVLVSDTDAVSDIAAEAREGKLRSLTEDEACAGRHGGEHPDHQRGSHGCSATD